MTELIAKPLWEISTTLPKGITNGTWPYANWRDFCDCSPWKKWNGYTVVNWSWVNNMFYIIFSIDYINTDIRVCTVPVRQEDETVIRKWLLEKRPVMWNI